MTNFSLSIVAAVLTLMPAAALSLRAENPAESAKGFDVETLKISPEELAEELGVKFHGTTWHFTAPTYVRLKVWNVGDNSTNSPKNPEKSLPPDAVLKLDGPLKTASLRVVFRETDDEEAHKREPDGTSRHLTFKVHLQGQDAVKGGDPAGKDGLQDLVTTLLGKKLSNEATFDRSSGETYSSAYTRRLHEGSGTADLWQEGDLGGLFSQLEQLRGAAVQPDAEAKVRELVARWRVEAEKNMLARPLKVYSHSTEISTHDQEKGREVKYRISFVLMLECSREPFPPEKPAVSPAQTP